MSKSPDPPESPKENSGNARRNNDREQEDVLEHKDHTIQSDRGLQQWGEMAQEDPEHDKGLEGEMAGQYGEASMGTAARQARIGGLAPGYKAGEGIVDVDNDDEHPRRHARADDDHDHEEERA